MSNLHAPTIPSGPTTNGSGPVLKTQGSSLAELHERKKAMEEELRALSGVLDSHGVDMNTRLLSPDGFPRADLDVAQIRTTRSRIIYLKNDYKALMATIEKAVHDAFANQGLGEEPSLSGTPDGSAVRSLPVVLSPPFAKVNSVVEGSPAYQAGLRAGDQIRKFGYVDGGNHEGLRRVGECVSANEGQNVQVKVSRPSPGGQRQELQLMLTPRRDWGGRGLLGCHILPI